MIEHLNPFEFIIACLASYRLSRLLVKEDGPFDLAYKLRIKTGIIYSDIDGKAIAWPPYNPLHCIWCTSIYIAAFIFLSWNWLCLAYIIFAISATVGLIDGYSND
jgi:hypothetical protein